MSKLGFDSIIRDLQRSQNSCLRNLMQESQKEFESNFDTESNTETNQSWAPVKREVPPKILVETESLKQEATKGKSSIIGNRIKLTIDPIDSRGRGYADYHQDGIGVASREYITHSGVLVDKHKRIILDYIDKALR